MPEELTDSEGNIVWRARYAAWGKLVFENVTGRAPGGFEQNLRMQGQYHDRGTGLYYNPSGTTIATQEGLPPKTPSAFSAA